MKAVYVLFILFGACVLLANATPTTKHDLLRGSLSLNPMQDLLDIVAQQGPQQHKQRSTKLCDYQRFHFVVSAIEYLINSLDDARDVEFLSDVLNAISANFTEAGSCIDIVGAILEVSNQTEVFADTTICHLDQGSSAYASDPCCNASLTLTQCCVPRDVSTTVNVLTGFRDAIVASQCKQGAMLEARFIKFFIEFQEGMQVCTELNGFDDAAYASVIEPLIECYDSVLEGRPCKSSADCFNGSTCVPFADVCTVPYDDISTPVIQCLIVRLADDVSRVLRRDLGLTIVDSDAKFEASLAAYLTDDSCRGPTSELYTDNQTYCENSKSCNDASITTEEECNGTFCSFCYAPNICANIPLENCTAICSNGQYVDDCSSTYVCSMQCGGSSCTTKDACEAQGTCSDDELLTGVCVSPFLADGSGHPTCATSVTKLQVGCLENNYLTSTSCVAAGFSWRTRANTTEECMAQGNFCQMADYSWDLSLQDAAQCSACGGTIVPAYTWQPALWVPGFVLPLQRIDRVWTSVNSWGPTLNSTKLGDIVNAIVIQKFVPVVKTMLQCAYLPYLTILDEAVCACSGDPSVPANCFPTVSTVAQIAEGLVFSGIEATIVSNGVTAVFANSSITVQDDAKNISIYIVLPPPTQSTSKRDTAVSTTVVDANGNNIGSLSGNQIQVSFQNTLAGSGYSLCIDITTANTMGSSCYVTMVYTPTPDTSSTIASGIKVQASASQVCASGITQAGYYAPGTICDQSTGSTSAAATGSTGSTGTAASTSTGNAPVHNASGKNQAFTFGFLCVYVWMMMIMMVVMM
jgi:hypothetical protein